MGQVFLTAYRFFLPLIISIKILLMIIRLIKDKIFSSVSRRKCLRLPRKHKAASEVMRECSNMASPFFASQGAISFTASLR